MYAAFFDNHNFYLWDESYVVPCNYTQNENDVVATLTFGGVDFGLQWRDIKWALLAAVLTATDRIAEARKWIRAPHTALGIFTRPVRLLLGWRRSTDDWAEPEFSHLTIIGGRFLVNVRALLIFTYVADSP